MVKRVFCGLFAAVLVAAYCTPTVSAAKYNNGFDTYGGYSETKTEYSFLTDESALVFGKDVDLDFTWEEKVFAGSDLYVPIGAYDTLAEDAEEEIATDKQIKNDKVQISYKVVRGDADLVDNVTLVSGKKEKLKELPAGMYAKVEFTDNFYSLNPIRLQLRLVLSVNGISYQTTAITFHADLQNRVEGISRNSVYGALTPSQFKASSGYRGEATFDFGDKVTYTSTVAASRKYYLNLDRSKDENLVEMYPDAYLECYNFLGENDTFSSIGELHIPVNKNKFKGKKTRAQVYAYELVGSELFALEPNEIVYDSKNNRLVLRTKTLGNYVLADRALMKNVAKSSEHDVLRSGYADEISDTNEPESSSESSKKSSRR